MILSWVQVVKGSNFAVPVFKALESNWVIEAYVLLPTYKEGWNKIYKRKLNSRVGPWKRLSFPTGGIRDGTRN